MRRIKLNMLMVLYGVGLFLLVWGGLARAAGQQQGTGPPITVCPV